MDNMKLLKKWLKNPENKKTLQKLLYQSLFETAQSADRIKREQKITWETLHRDLGEAIRKTRCNAGMSLRQLAKKLDCSAAFISDCEHGRRKMSLDRLAKYEQIARGG